MNQNRKNHPFLRRALTAVLTLLMLVNVCFPAMQAHATEETLETAHDYDVAVSAVKEAANALDPATDAETFKAAADAVTARIAELSAKVSAIVTDGAGITESNVSMFNTMLSDASTAVADKTQENAAYLAKQSQPPVTPAPSDNTSNVGDMDLDDEDDVIPPDPSENETPVLSEAAQAYTDRYNALAAEVDALQINDPEFETKFNDVYSRIATLNNEVSDAATAGTITVEEYGVLGNNLVMLGETLGQKMDENLSYDANTTAVPVNMDDYNANNYVAYDVAKTNTNPWKNKGYNDTKKTYVSKVTLGGVEVEQANSNLSGYGDDGYYGRPRVGQKLSNYYKGIDKGSANTYATLTITPSTGYYVSRIVVACCDGGAPYDCGTWENGLEFSVSFNVSAGGDLSIQLPSKAFGHGTDSGFDESPKGEEQYFILIEVAPVPTPLYVEYLPGIATSFDEKLFNDSDAWTLNSSSNNYDVGSMEQPNTRFKYAYTNKVNVSKWEHYANTITDNAIKAAAENGYYFAGWKAVYYQECDSNYNFDTVYSRPEELIPQGTEVRLITHVRLTAQWEPVKLNVTKTVGGLSNYEGTYTVQLKKDDVDLGQAHDFAVTGSGTSDAWTISPVVPGTYSIVETSPAVGSYVTDNGTTKYLVSTTYSDPITITADKIADGTYREGTLTVTNTYSDATPKLKLVKQWQNASGEEITGEATSHMPIVTFTISCETHNFTKTQTVAYSDNWVKTLDAADLSLPSGCSIADLTVTETVPTGYELVGNVAKTTEEDTENKIVYTVYTATNKQSVTSLTLDKNVTGNMGDWSKKFTFNIYLNDSTTPFATETLTHNTAAVTIDNIPIGATVKIVESDNENYKVSATVNNVAATVTAAKDGSDSISFTASATASENSVVFTNHYSASIETGITSHSFPFILLLSTAIVFAMILLLDKARYSKKF